MSRKTIWIAYSVFLIAFAAFKYLSAAPDAFSSQYAISVVILVVLTGVIPFVVAARLAGRVGSTSSRWGVAMVSALIVCCAGYAGYFKLFIEPQNLGVSMSDVALRGIYAGTIQGVLAALHAMTARQ